MKLDGIRVIDLSQFLPGPHLTMMMADHGAEVIKIEPPGEGDPARQIGLRQGEHSVFFRNTNRGKHSVVLNLKHAAAQEILLRLAATADVFIESFRPGVAARLGVDYPSVAARNPPIVYCSISAFGQHGPYRDVPAHDLAVEALGGTLSINLGADDEPAMPGVPISDIAASLMALSGILMALLKRKETGRGDYLDISMHDCLLASLPNALGPVFAEKRAPVPKHERTWGGSAFYRIYRTKDARHIVLGGQELKFVRNLLGELGRPELIPLCERGPGPHQQPLIEFLAEIFASRTRREWIDWFVGRDIAFAPVNTLREAFDDAHAHTRQMRIVDDSGLEHIGMPIKFKHEPAGAHFDAPEAGNGTRRILESLGYHRTTIEELEAAGTVHNAQ